MARTFNRRPVTIDGPDNSDIKNYTFNYEQWKGIDDGKNFLSVDQFTFSDAQNMYIDSEGLLSSRPAVEETLVDGWNQLPQKILNYYEYPNNKYASTIRLFVGVGDVPSIASDVQMLVLYDTYSFFKVRHYVTYTNSATALLKIKCIDSFEKLYIFATKNAETWTSNVSLYIYDKFAGTMSYPANNIKSIYVPTTKIFTGSNEEEGEAVNLWTTSERYLYYYNDVTGINGDAIGKTLTWDEKTLIWSDNFKKYLVKDYYNIGDSTIASVAATGAVAWVQSNILYYAVHGAIIYSWDCSSLIDSSHAITKIYFSDASDIILIHVSDSDNIYHATYIVSCVSTTENNTLKYPTPTELLSLVGLTPQPDIYSISCEKFIDESAWMIAALAAATGIDGAVAYGITTNYKYNDLQKEVTTRGDVIGVDFTANLLAILSTYKKDSDQKKYYRIQLSKWSEDGKTIVAVGYKDYLLNNLPNPTNRSSLVIFKFVNANIIAYVPHIAINPDKLDYYVICLPMTDFISKNIAVRINYNKLYIYPPVILRDAPLIALFKDKSYDCRNCDFVNNTIQPKENSYLVNGITPLESTASLYNYTKQVGNENHIFTRFSTDTFELYYDKAGEVTYPKSITDILYLNNYFFAVDNMLYHTENRYNDDGEFLFYLPKKNRNEFDSTITKLHQIGDDIIAIFFENEIHYAKYDTDVGTYRYYKSKLQFGLPKGADVVTSDDSITTYFATTRGIMALSYQNFIATTEQATVPISDPVFNLIRDFLKDKAIKIYKKDYWVAFYNGTSILWLYDIRNQSWWVQKFSKNLTFIGSKEKEPLIILDKKLHQLMKNDVYLDDYETEIDWYFKSQKLHLGAPNYFKSVQGMTFFDSSEEDYENIFDLETYAYRDKPYVNGEQNVHYDVRMIRTYLLRMHTMKTNEFQFKISSDNTIAQEELRHQLKLSSISIRYRITGEVR
uniref:Uncharacterized protein n=1 Tax=Siphoviridae sp. ctv4j104 TaxID=2826510 RepID=A0A8S5MAP2_9CAUD|nr:MAG TPA: hypothetical protein [Siphoviridae sp. ctv4j104]